MPPLAATLWLALGALPLLGARLTVTSVLAFPLIMGIGMGVLVALGLGLALTLTLLPALLGLRGRASSLRRPGPGR